LNNEKLLFINWEK